MGWRCWWRCGAIEMAAWWPVRLRPPPTMPALHACLPAVLFLTGQPVRDPLCSVLPAEGGASSRRRLAGWLAGWSAGARPSGGGGGDGEEGGGGARGSWPSVGVERVPAISAMLMLVGIMRTHFDAAEAFGWESMGGEVAHRLIAVLRLLNRRTAELVLGAAAIHTAGARGLTIAEPCCCLRRGTRCDAVTLSRVGRLVGCRAEVHHGEAPRDGVADHLAAGGARTPAQGGAAPPPATAPGVIDYRVIDYRVIDYRVIDYHACRRCSARAPRRSSSGCVHSSWPRRRRAARRYGA
jgi:hypothetical protein